MVSEEHAHCCIGSKIHDLFFFLQILICHTSSTRRPCMYFAWPMKERSRNTESQVLLQEEASEYDFL